MFTRVLISLFVLGTPSLAQAKPHHAHKRALLSPRAPSGMVEGKLDAETGIGPALPPPLPVEGGPGFVAVHSARVERDLMLFQPNLVGLLPGARSHNADLVAPSPKKPHARFYAPLRTADDLEVHRERDRLALFRAPQPQSSAEALGVALFGGVAILSAHAPRPFRVLFDGPVHVGPAIFDGGGMGAGIGARWL